MDDDASYETKIHDYKFGVVPTTELSDTSVIGPVDIHIDHDGCRIVGKLRTSLIGSRLEVDSYLGQLRIRYSGPPSAVPVEVHVGATDDFEPTAATLVGRLSGSGAVFASAPVGVDRFVRTVQQSKAVCTRVLPVVMDVA